MSRRMFRVRGFGQGSTEASSAGNDETHSLVSQTKNPVKETAPRSLSNIGRYPAEARGGSHRNSNGFISKESDHENKSFRRDRRLTPDPIKGLISTLSVLNNAVHSGIARFSSAKHEDDERECLFNDESVEKSCHSHTNGVTVSGPERSHFNKENSRSSRRNVFGSWGKWRQESARLLDHEQDDEEVRVIENSEEIECGLLAAKKSYVGVKCEPPPMYGDDSGAYHLAMEDDEAGDTHESEEEDIVEKQREEIDRLKDRISMLESELKLKRDLDEVFVVEGSSSESSSEVDEDSDEDSLEDGDSEEVRKPYSAVPPDDVCLNGDIENSGPSGGADVLINTSISTGNGLKPEPSNRILGLTIRESHGLEEDPLICPFPSRSASQLSEAMCSSLTKDQVERYSRHLLLADGFGVSGQMKLLESSVLVIGAGGIGSTVLLYLAASGIGSIGVADFDSVEASNLHRQIIHSETKLGMNKALSAVMRMQELNPTVNCVAIQEPIHHRNVLRFVSAYDCVVDASDNPLTRYLINDACVLAKKPLVSGSAMGTEGQLTVYNYLGGPCYRCLYPRSSPSEGCKSCSDSGVLGPVPGLIGVLQAIEVIKVLTGLGSTMHDKILMYDALSCSFIGFKKPFRRKTCAVCGPDATIQSMDESMGASRAARGPADFKLFRAQSDNEIDAASLPLDLCVSCSAFDTVRQSAEQHVLLDVRVERQFAMVSLRGSVNIPLERLHDQLSDVERLSDGRKVVYCVCRRGIASAQATRIIANAIDSGHYPGIRSVRNISGGLAAWAKEVDTSFPLY